jgi:serine/threonine-protein kinase SRPK3
MWDLLQGKNLFQTKGLDGKDSSPRHVAQMISLLGPPPPEMLRKSSRTREFYNEDGTYGFCFARHMRCSLPPGSWKELEEIPSISLEDSITLLADVEKADFISFARKMLQWDPEKRSAAKDLYEDPWLRC